jgi:serine/threonine-protein kinase RsbW
MSASIRNPAAELAIDAEADQVRVASAWMAEVCMASGVPDDAIHRLDLCLNEALANTLSHGSPAFPRSQVHLLVDVQRDGEAGAASVTVSDAGPAFDMTQAGAKPRPKTLADAEPGGLGLLMIRSFSDHLDYRFVDGRNVLTFTVRWMPGR